MTRKRFAVLVAVLIVVASAFYGSGAMDATAEAGPKDLRFEWHAASGMTLDNPACDQTNAGTAFDNCPDMATAPNGETIEMIGQGTLSIKAKNGKPKKVRGGGEFVHTIGGVPFTGTWKAKKLLMFDDYGPGPSSGPGEVPQDWRAGRAMILVELVADGTGMKANAILELGCRLNAPDTQPGGGVPGTIEGIRIVIDGGLNFNVAADPRSTLFVDLN